MGVDKMLNNGRVQLARSKAEMISAAKRKWDFDCNVGLWCLMVRASFRIAQARNKEKRSFHEVHRFIRHFPGTTGTNRGMCNPP